MKKIFVVGSINQDIVVRTPRIPKAGETILGKELNYFPGGKGANQAIAAKLFGGEVFFVGKVGGDAFGNRLKVYLKKFNLHKNIEITNKYPTGTALINVDDNGKNSITIVSGANGELRVEDCAIIDKGEKGDFLVLQNEILLTVNINLIKKAKRLGIISIFNPAPAVKLPDDCKIYPCLVIVNEHEFETFFNKKLEDIKNRVAVGEILLKLSERFEMDIVLTLGSKGVIGASKGKVADVKGIKVDAIDTTGAGDCFIGAFAYKLSTGENFEKSIIYANKAAALSVTKMGASMSFSTKVSL